MLVTAAFAHVVGPSSVDSFSTGNSFHRVYSSDCPWKITRLANLGACNLARNSSATRGLMSRLGSSLRAAFEDGSCSKRCNRFLAFALHISASNFMRSYAV